MLSNNLVKEEHPRGMLFLDQHFEVKEENDNERRNANKGNLEDANIMGEKKGISDLPTERYKDTTDQADCSPRLR